MKRMLKEPNASFAKVRALFLKRQQTWASEAGLPFDDKGYLDSVDANLRVPMRDSVREAFDDADGSELEPSRGRPPKMCALHSSSALAVNFFDYWIDRDTAPLLQAMGLHASGSPRFEVKFPLGLGGKPPNLDVIFGCSPDFVAAIESKFGEWLSQKRPKPERFKAKYFPSRHGLWERAGLPACQSLANDIRNSRTWFSWLDAPQLLKHALGLATQQGNKFSLTYLSL
jgi:hypothetical protein